LQEVFLLESNFALDTCTCDPNSDQQSLLRHLFIVL
jgi:hypothetical protein